MIMKYGDWRFLVIRWLIGIYAGCQVIGIGRADWFADAWMHPGTTDTSGQLQEPSLVKVACPGGSITWGYWSGTMIWEKSYPDILGQLLGTGFEVRNFGNPGRTAGNYPGYGSINYRLTPEHAALTAWQANAIVGSLGLNDCQSFYDEARFVAGYLGLIGDWTGGRADTRLYLWGKLTPDYRGTPGIPAFPGNVFEDIRVFSADDYGTSVNRLDAEQALSGFKISHGSHLLDAYSGLEDKPLWFPDGLHPTDKGLRHLANVAFSKMIKGLPAHQEPVISEIMPFPVVSGLTDEDGEIQPWIELWNPADRGLSLEGYLLESTGEFSGVWEFPDYSVLPPNGRCIVFASGKNKRVPTGNLHTGFVMDSGSTRLLLRKRDTSVADYVDIPVLARGKSYGIGEGSFSLMKSDNSAARSLLTELAPSGWHENGFDDSSWENGAAIGLSDFPVKAEADFTHRWGADDLTTDVWNFFPGGGSWTSLGDGTCLVSGSGPHALAAYFDGMQDRSWTAEVRLRVESHTGEHTGFVLQGSNWAGGGRSGSLGIGTDVTKYGWKFQSARMLSHASNSSTFHTFRIAYDATDQRFHVWRDGLLISSCLYGLGGDHSRNKRMLMGALSSSHSIRAVIDHASYDITGAYAPVPDGWTPVSTGTVLIRIPFEIATPHSDVVKLRLWYDDGFSAWLNGTRILSGNAPDQGVVAVRDRPASRARRAVTFDLSAHRSLFRTDTNLLAIQGFNAAQADGVFTMRAEIETRGSSTRRVVHNAPTPLLPNGAGKDAASSWFEENFGGKSGSFLEGTSLDADGDGLSNLLEYAFGLDPQSPDGSGVVRIEGKDLVFPWAGMPDVSWHLLVSRDLEAWEVVGKPRVTGVQVGGKRMLCVDLEEFLMEKPAFFRIYVRYSPDWETWRNLHFGQTSASGFPDSAYESDPDGDGMCNLLEYALGSPPLQSNRNPVSVRTNPARLLFPLPAEHREIIWKIETSADLLHWSKWTGPTMIIHENGMGLMVSAALQGNQTQFYRIRIVFRE